MSDRAGRISDKSRLMDALDEVVKKAQLESVFANKGSDVELALNPATLKDVLKHFGVPSVHAAHDGNQNVSYQGIPIRESADIPPGKAFIVDRGAEIRGAQPTEVVYDDDEVPFVRSRNAFVNALVGDEWKKLGVASVDAADSLRGFTDAALAVSGRMLPPPEWQDRAVRAAQAAGMDLEWCQQVRARAGGTDTWARVTTGRGGFDVRPEASESWTQALAAAGIDVPLDAVA